MVTVDGPLLDRIAARRRFETRTLDIARRLFIHDQTPKRVASEFGVNLQRVYAVRKQILSAAESLALPPGWVREELVGPRALVEHHKRLFKAAMDEIDSGFPARTST